MVERVRGATAILEDELLRCCARVSPTPDALARIEQLVRQPLDWETLLDRSWWHRIRPLTYRHLRAQAAGAVPDHVLLELARHAGELTIRNRRLSQALTDVASMFQGAGLRALVFKGPTLAEDAYGDLCLRECGDLDLLVSGCEFPKIEAMLRSQGFTSWWDRDQANRQVFACEFQRDDATLDVHWKLAPDWLNYRVDFERLWTSGLPTSTSGDLFRKLLPEDAVSVLCIHGTKHWWERLRWIADVAELIDSGLIKDWDRVHRSATQSHALRSVQLGVWLAQELLSAKLPADVRQQLERTSRTRRLGNQVRAWLAESPRAGESRRLRERFLFRMGVCERMRDRVPQIVHYLMAHQSQQVE
jgi:hypothetical protein